MTLGPRRCHGISSLQFGQQSFRLARHSENQPDQCKVHRNSLVTTTIDTDPAGDILTTGRYRSTRNMTESSQGVTIMASLAAASTMPSIGLFYRAFRKHHHTNNRDEE